MRQFLILASVLSLGLPFVRAQPIYDLRSPDGTIAVRVGLSADGPFYRVSYRERPVLLDSTLAWEIQDQPTLGPNLVAEDALRRTIDTRWRPVWGTTQEVIDRARELRLRLRERSGPERRLDLVFRASNDGVAFRAVFPEQPVLTSLSLRAEATAFRFPGDPVLWAPPFGRFVSSQETAFPQTRLSALHPGTLYGTPWLLRVGAGSWVGLTEADLTDWAGMYLVRDAHDPQALVTRLAPRHDDPNLCVRTTTPRRSPWRVILIGDRPGALIESNLVTRLSEPCQLQDTAWIRPGKCAWDWWWSGRYAPDVDFKLGPNQDTMKYFIDFAAEMGWPYQLVDWQWYGPPFADTVGGQAHPSSDITTCEPGIDVPALVRYAAARGVRLWVWCHWQHVEEQMDKAFPLYERWGVAGVKIDFMDRDDQDMVNFYRRVVRKAAAHHLLIDFHGAYRPTGLRRAYPNLLTREGVMGNEYNKWSDKVTLDHCLTLPFTRMLAGPMDFTPGGWRNVGTAPFEPVGGDAPAPQVRGTRCFQLAMMVVYESPLQVLCDSPYAYRQSPAGLDLLRRVPTTWDETHVLHGEVGDTITVARRAGRDWYVGSMTDATPRRQELVLDFLRPGQVYRATVWQDDPVGPPTALRREAYTVRRGDRLIASMVAGGGHVVFLTPR